MSGPIEQVLITAQAARGISTVYMGINDGALQDMARSGHALAAQFGRLMRLDAILTSALRKVQQDMGVIQQVMAQDEQAAAVAAKEATAQKKE